MEIFLQTGLDRANQFESLQKFCRMAHELCRAVSPADPRQARPDDRFRRNPPLIRPTELLRPREHIIRALADALRTRRTLTGAEVDVVIMQAVAAKALADEHARRAAWKRSEESAALFSGSIAAARAPADRRCKISQCISGASRARRRRVVDDGGGLAAADTAMSAFHLIATG